MTLIVTMAERYNVWGIQTESQINVASVLNLLISLFTNNIISVKHHQGRSVAIVCAGNGEVCDTKHSAITPNDAQL